mmetsp:Transcript_102625/g.153812  ORF Transcript_102625/g.153812 Transcript_102625/m.153812 type:complete len:147 (+) Transcript_102625:74-514(+)
MTGGTGRGRAHAPTPAQRCPPQRKHNGRLRRPSAAGTRAAQEAKRYAPPCAATSRGWQAVRHARLLHFGMPGCTRLLNFRMPGCTRSLHFTVSDCNRARCPCFINAFAKRPCKALTGNRSFITLFFGWVRTELAMAACSDPAHCTT